MHSQYDEDDLIFEHIPRKNTGLYVDIGAGDPKVFSNTYMLYQLGWRGIVVEPFSSHWDDWKNARPEDILITDAITDKNGVANMSTTVLDGTFLFEEYSATKPVREVKCRTFANLMEEYPKFLGAEFFSLDVELSEDKVLSTVDFTKFKPTLMIIENAIRGVDSRPRWQHLILPYYNEVRISTYKEDTLGNSFYVRKT